MSYVEKRDDTTLWTGRPSYRPLEDDALRGQHWTHSHHRHGSHAVPTALSKITDARERSRVDGSRVRRFSAECPSRFSRSCVYRWLSESTLGIRMFRTWVCSVRDRDWPGTSGLAKSPHPPNRARDGLLFPIEGVRRHVQGRMKIATLTACYDRGRCFAMYAAASARRDRPSLSRIRLT